MKKPPQELIDAFFNWYNNDPHSKNEDYYKEAITKDHLAGLSESDFIDFFYQFARVGGKIQSGGQRSSNKFRQTIETQYDQFRQFVLNPFDPDFSVEKWLTQIKTFKHFGIGLATIYLNRVDKKRFSILNNKVTKSLALLDVTLPANEAKRYQSVQDAQKQLITWFPAFDNYYRADALNEFFVGNAERRKMVEEMLSKYKEAISEVHYWIYAPGPNAKFWDECWEKGIMVYGADELLDLQTYNSKAAIEKALKDTLGLKSRPTNDARAAWEFSRVVKPGDVIIAKKGRKLYIGYGIVTGGYIYDADRPTYRNVRTVKWLKKGEWNEPGGPIVLKTLTDITKYPEYVEKLKKLIGIKDQIPNSPKVMPPLNTILYGPPGTGKTYALRNEYMKLFTERQMVTSEQFARELVGELTWLQVIAIVLYDLKSAKVPAIFDHPLLQAKIRLQANRNPKNTIWAWLQRHTKIDCPTVKFAQRDEPLIFWKDENATWNVDQAMVDEQLPELIVKLRMFREFKPITKEITRYEYVTFHQSYSYEDFVEGIKPVMSEEDASALAYEIKPGIFKNMVAMALNDPNQNFALLIDEINRGNVANIFGELIALIEEDKRKGKASELKARLPYSREEFVVPDNLYIIGAMNTADRSVEALDTALRRRFTFVAAYPQPDLIQQPIGFDVDLQKLLITINGRIEKLLDKDHCIGHSYFMDVDKKTEPLVELQLIFKTKILPLLEEYFYGDPGKIGMVLGERFVARKDEAIVWAAGDWGMEDYEERRVYTFNDPMTLKIEDFRSVYE
jgi:hypothetical protein